jgi:hypothetical protein
LVEQRTSNPRVVGSSPATPAKLEIIQQRTLLFFYGGIVQLAEQQSPKLCVVGSSPATPAILNEKKTPIAWCPSRLIKRLV